MIKRLRSCHTSLKHSLEKLGTVLSAVCDCGTGIETADRIFWECSCLTKERAEIINILTKSGDIKFINDIPKYM
jgi:hypothetical protein